MIGGWNFCSCVAQDIKRLAGEEFYKQYGQYVIDCVMTRCSEGLDIVRYPEDEEVLKVIELCKE